MRPRKQWLYVLLLLAAVLIGVVSVVTMLGWRGGRHTAPSPPGRGAVAEAPSGSAGRNPVRSPPAHAGEPAPRARMPNDPSTDPAVAEKIRQSRLFLAESEIFALRLECTLQPAILLGSVTLEVRGERVLGRVLGGVAVLPLTSVSGDVREGTGWLAVKGYRPTRVTWSDVAPGVAGACEPDPVPIMPGVPFRVTGRVVFSTGEVPFYVAIQGCGPGSGAADGEFELELLDGEPCDLVARLLERPVVSEPVRVVPTPNGEVSVELVLPGGTRDTGDP